MTTKITSDNIKANSIVATSIRTGTITNELLGAGVGGGAAFNQAANDTGYFGLPVGTTGQRPETPTEGMIRYNTTLGSIEIYNSAGWEQIGGSVIISTVSPTTFDGINNTLFTINGQSFAAGAIVKFITSGGVEYTSNTTNYLSSLQLTARTPRIFTVADEPLTVKVVNPSGTFALKSDIVDCGGSPAFSVSSGSIGNIYNSNRSELSHLNASATDSEGSSISHSVLTGSLPTGLSMSANGVFYGTADPVASDSTFTFTIRAEDPSGNQTDRQFSIVVKAPIEETITTVGETSWTSPAGVNTLTRVRMLGGGGGGTASFQSYGMGGGGAGYIDVTDVAITSNTTYTVTVGSGGLGAVAVSGASIAGSDGGNTTAFDNTANGGQGGQPAFSGTGGSYTINNGTNNGSANGLTPTSSGNNGKPGGNNGGGSTYGTGSAPTGNYSAGLNATGYGNGAGGGSSSQNWIGIRSGTGSGGLVILNY